MGASAHIRMHNGHSYGEDFDADAHGAAIRDALRRRALDPNWLANFSAAQSRRARQFWHADRYADTRARVIEARRNPSDATREAHRRATIERYASAEARAAALR